MVGLSSACRTRSHCRISISSCGRNCSRWYEDPIPETERISCNNAHGRFRQQRGIRWLASIINRTTRGCWRISSNGRGSYYTAGEHSDMNSGWSAATACFRNRCSPKLNCFLRRSFLEPKYPTFHVRENHTSVYFRKNEKRLKKYDAYCKTIRSARCKGHLRDIPQGARTRSGGDTFLRWIRRGVRYRAVSRQTKHLFNCCIVPEE